MNSLVILSAKPGPLRLGDTKTVRVLLVSTYELGRQPFGLASPTACLRADGHQVTCIDLAVEQLSVEVLRSADLIAFHLPMHTATRLAVPIIEASRRVNPGAHVCCYGLYAPVNADYLRSLGVATLIGGEFEDELRRLAQRLASGDKSASGETVMSFERMRFETPDRSGLPPLSRYATLFDGSRNRITGYTETTRGCKHLCRHCPVVPVYNGTFRVIPAGVVLADIRQQVESGAQHITFGDPDFFNGPAHGMRIVQQMKKDFPSLTYDVTIKIEHLLKHRDLLPELQRTGCLMVTTAVESVDDTVLSKLDKGHTKADFIEVVRLFREAGLNLSPTFIPFTPWTTWESYRELLRALAELDLVHHVAPVQLALRLLIPAGSRLLELEEISGMVDQFQPEALGYKWRHQDPSLDELAERLLRLVDSEQKRGASRAECFTAIWAEASGGEAAPVLAPEERRSPQHSEPWFCCAEPMQERVTLV
jgi:radical SAM superfamily enzyme YgiQ (UPF0313 family)